MRLTIPLFLLPVALNFIGCATHVSSQQTMADDRNLVYEDTYKAYREAEEKYLNLLFNIERMPEEQELWVMKRERMIELMQLKELMLNEAAMRSAPAPDSSSPANPKIQASITKQKRRL